MPNQSSRPKFELRPYQKAAIESVYEARARGVKRMVVCLPTGAGKTVIFSQLTAREAQERHVLVLAHREELLEQARDKLDRAMEGRVRVEIEQGARVASPEARVVVCSIRSLREERLKRLIQDRDIGLVIYDECHHATADDNRRVLAQLGAFDPHWRGTLLGFTATTTRGDGVGLDLVFQEIVYTRSILEMVRDDYLVPLRGYRVSTMADLRALTSAGLDFNQDELAEAVDIQERNALVARAIQELARDRRTIVFCVTVAHARNLAAALRLLGIPAATIHGEMKRDDRARTLENFRRGRWQAITNVGVLTEGFDDPGVSCIAMARPTRSQGLYAQCIGRGTRLAPGKEDCLILDFVDLSDLSLVTLPSLFGLPHALDLDGEEVGEARQQLWQLSLDFPGFEIEASEITLDEIKRRAESFDPLTMDINPEVMAISPHAWVSLGSAGLVLHFQRKRDRLSEMLILDSRRRGANKYQVYFDQEEVASFSTVEQAIEAVDYEIRKMGARPAETARDEAPWRHEPPSPKQIEALRALTPPRSATTAGEAVRYLAFARYARKRRFVRPPAR